MEAAAIAATRQVGNQRIFKTIADCKGSHRRVIEANLAAQNADRQPHREAGR